MKNPLVRGGWGWWGKEKGVSVNFSVSVKLLCVEWFITPWAGVLPFFVRHVFFLSYEFDVAVGATESVTRSEEFWFTGGFHCSIFPGG
jgi:hypothetical protein